MSGFDAIFRGGSPEPRVPAEFIKAVEADLAERLGQRVQLTVAVTAITISWKGKLGLGNYTNLMALDWFLHRETPRQWADLIERRLRGDETFGDLADNAELVEEIFDAFQASPSVVETGRIALDNAAKYDHEFFAALDEVIARDRAYLLAERVEKLEGMRDYLRQVRQWYEAGELETAREAIARGAALDNLKESLKDDPNAVVVDLDEICGNIDLSDVDPSEKLQIVLKAIRKARSKPD